MISAGSILEGAFGLLRDHPAAVAVWGLIYFAAVAGMSLAIQPLLGNLTDPEAMAANMQNMFGQLMLFQFGFLILYVAMWTAAQRAILRPSQSGLAFIRFGMDEIRMFIVMIILGITFYFGFVLAIIAVTLVTIAGYAAGGMVGAVAAAAIGSLLAFGIVIWLLVRLSLAFPLTLLRRDIVIGESWRLTQGRFWPLFAAYLVIFLVITALSIAASFATTGSYLVDIIQNIQDPAALQGVIEAQMARQFGEVTAMTVLGWTLSAIAGALAIALFGGALATAVRGLTEGQESMADTFT